MEDNNYVRLINEIEFNPKYYYKVTIFVNTLEKEMRSFDHEELFEGSNLIECRNKAISFYKEQIHGLSKGLKFHDFPFTSYENSEYGKTAAFSINLIFCREGEDIEEYIISGEGEKEQTLADLAVEYITLIDLGYNKDEISLVLSDGVTIEQLNQEIISRVK